MRLFSGRTWTTCSHLPWRKWHSSSELWLMNRCYCSLHADLFLDGKKLLCSRPSVMAMTSRAAQAEVMNKADLVPKCWIPFLFHSVLRGFSTVDSSWISCLINNIQCGEFIELCYGRGCHRSHLSNEVGIILKAQNCLSPYITFSTRIQFWVHKFAGPKVKGITSALTMIVRL